MNSKEIIDRYIGALEDDLQHYTMVDKDSVKAKLIQFELEEYKQIKKDLERFKIIEEENKQLKNELHSIYCYGTGQAKQDLLEENEKLKQKLDYINSFSYSMPTYYRDIIKEVLENE